MHVCGAYNSVAKIELGSNTMQTCKHGSKHMRCDAIDQPYITPTSCKAMRHCEPVLAVYALVYICARWPMHTCTCMMLVS